MDAGLFLDNMDTFDIGKVGKQSNTVLLLLLLLLRDAVPDQFC